MNMGQHSDFDDAVKSANGKLTDSSKFILAIDVKRARHSGIRPVPQRVLNGQIWEIEEDTALYNKDTAYATPQSINPYDLSGNETQTVITKQLLWERRLLDLSLRNNLLNIRITKNTLQLIPANLSCLEDAFSRRGRVPHPAPSFRLGESGHGVRDLFFNTGFRPDY